MPLRSAISLLVLCLGLSATVAPAAAQDQCQQTCLSALEASAYNETKVTESTTNHHTFVQRFCDAVHQRLQNKTSVESDTLTAYFFNTLNVNNETLSQYDRLYCQSSFDETDYSKAYSFWSKVANDNDLDKFNGCMRICNPGVGIATEVQQRGPCGYVVTVKYNPANDGDKTNPVVTRDSVLFNASCRNAPYHGQSIPVGGTSGLNIECTRFGFSGSFVSFSTNKGPVVAGPNDLPAPKKPEPPVMQTSMQDTDETGKQYVTSCAISNTSWRATHGPCDTCSGTCSVQEGGIIPNVSYIDYTCNSGANEHNDSYCGWSYNPGPERGRGKNVVVLGNTNYFTWYRWWQTGAPLTDVYTIRYQMPRSICVSGDCPPEKYKADLAEYQKAMSVNPCPWTPDPPSLWDRLWSNKKQ